MLLVNIIRYIKARQETKMTYEELIAIERLSEKYKKLKARQEFETFKEEFDAKLKEAKKNDPMRQELERLKRQADFLIKDAEEGKKIFEGL